MNKRLLTNPFAAVAIFLIGGCFVIAAPRALATTVGGSSSPSIDALPAGIDIVDPYSVIKPFNYKGNTHSHTTDSTDGVDTPAQIMTFYKNAGYDFNAITDHEFVTSDPGVPGILFIKGTEDGLGATGRDHMIKLGPNVTATLLTDDQQSIDTALAEGDYVGINHPDGLTDWPLDTILNTSGQYTIAIWNGKRALEYPAQVDAALNAGRRLNLIAEEDVHDIADPMAGLSGIHVWADSLTSANIIAGIETGDYYSTYTPAGQIEQVVAVETVGGRITVTSNQSSNFVFYGKGATLQTNDGVTSASYTIVGDEKYVRVRVTGGAAVAWTNPIFIEHSVAAARRSAPHEELLPVNVTDMPLTVSYNQEGTLTQHLVGNITAKLSVPAGGAFDPAATGGGAIFKLGDGPEDGALNGRFIELTATDCSGGAIHKFSKNLTIIFSGLKLPADVSALTISYFDVATKTWVEVAGAQFDPVKGTATFAVDHLTKFAVMDHAAPAPDNATEEVEPVAVAPAAPAASPPAVLGIVVYADGALIRGSDKKIFVIVNGRKAHIHTWAELAAHYPGKPILDVSDDIITQY